MEIISQSLSAWFSAPSSSSSSPCSSDNEQDQPPYKIQKLELEDPIKFKLLKYLDQFAAAVKSGEFVVRTQETNVPTIGLRIIETGKLLRFPLQEDDLVPEELAASEFEIMNSEDWSTCEECLADEVQTGFGLDTDVRISLKKLIIQKTGSNFPTNLEDLFSSCNEVLGEESKKRVPFGHLIIQLPSHYTGGQFRFRHEGNVKEFHMATSMTTREGWTAQPLAFYAQLDQQDHDEILTGVRSCLIYNLEIELDDAKPQVPPQPPSLKNITPTLFQIIQEWKWKGSDTSAKMLPLTCTNKKVKPSVVATFLAPLLRDNGITLFHGKKDFILGNSEDETVHLVGRLRMLTSVDVQEEAAFSSFLKDEVDNPEDLDEEDSTTGLEFDLRRDQTEHEGGFDEDMYLFFLSDDGQDIFENQDWRKSGEFWRFKSHLFLTKYGDATSPRTWNAANALVYLEITTPEYDDLFQNPNHFKNLLKKFLDLEDTQTLKKFLQICQEKSDFNKLFPSILYSGIEWTILRSALQEFFDVDEIEDGNRFARKVSKISVHIQVFEFGNDKDREELYFGTFESILKKFQVLYSTDKFEGDKEFDVIFEFFRISEVLKYNLFQFMKSKPAAFVRKVFSLSSRFTKDMRVMWVRLVTDLYSCTKLFENWPHEDEYHFLLHFFRIAENIRADIKGILGQPKKYGVLVNVLSRFGNFNEDEWYSDDEEDIEESEQLPKFWIPFATRLEARMAAIFPDLETDRREQGANIGDDIGDPPNDGNDDLVGIQMLNKIRKLLPSRADELKK